MSDHKNDNTGKSSRNLKTNTAPANVIQCGDTILQTPDDMINFLGAEKEWFRLLIEKQKKLVKLVEWIGCLQGEQNRRRFESLIQTVKPQGAGHVREALVRFLKPESPVKVVSDIDLFHTDDPEKTAKEFTVQLDQLWRKAGLSDMDLYVFSFGIALEQMIWSATGERKKAAESVLERISRCFKHRTDQPADSSAPQDSDWTLPRKDVTDEGLVNLFYEFNPGRTFRDNEGNNFSEIKEIGLLFAAHPEYWDDRFLKEERNHYLRDKNLTTLINKKREDFLLRAFGEHSVFDIDIIQTYPDTAISHDGPSAVIVYRITCNANQFLEDHGIKEKLMEEVDRNRIVMPSFLSSSAWDLGAALLKELDKKYMFTENRWASYSVGMIQENFSRFQEYLKENVKTERKSMTRKHVWQTLQSFFVLFPVVVFYFISIAYFEKSFKLINFLSGFTPFIMTFDDPWVVESKTSNFGLPFLVLFSVMPALILTFRKEYLAGYIVSLVIWLSLLGPFTFLFPLPLAGLTLLGVPILMFAAGLFRIKIIPLFLSLLLFFVVIFSGELALRDKPPSTGVQQPLNVSARATGWEVFRSGPSESHSPVGLLQFHDTVNILARENGWSLIRFKDAEGYIQDSLVPQPPLFYAVVTDSAVPMMSEPSLNSRVLEMMPVRESVSVFGIEGDWFCIRRGFDYRSRKGYVLRKSVNVVRE